MKVTLPGEKSAQSGGRKRKKPKQNKEKEVVPRGRERERAKTGKESAQTIPRTHFPLSTS